MNPAHLSILACPECHSGFRIDDANVRNGRIESGQLVCVECAGRYPILRGIPRFVPSSNYADGFGFQWARHAETQHDRFTGTSISAERFFNETRWPRRLEGERLLEVGCGSGRFTTHALSTGATVVAVDLSAAVDENRRLHADHENLLVVQADLCRLPLPKYSCDRVFCLGVLQHTPNVEHSFRTLLEYLKPHGQLTVDVYDRREGWTRWIEPLYRTYYWFRPLTKRMPKELLYRFVSRYVRLMWPLSRRVATVPKLGRVINRMLLIHDYRERYELAEEQLMQWAILDTFDNLAARYDQRQTLSTVRRWFAECDLTDVDVHYGYNGIEARATKC